MDNLEKTFEGLTNLIVSEQLLESVSKELATFLKGWSLQQRIP